jgi:hypothetical protein
MIEQTIVAATPRALAAYLTAIRGLMEEATAIRRSWIRQVGMLILDARTKPPDMVAPMVLRCGKENRELFVGFRVRLDEIKPPSGCDACQAAFAAWLDKQTAACDALIDIGTSSDLVQLRAVQRLLAEGRVDTQAFNAEYSALLTALKQRIAARKAAKGMHWPFRAKSSA